MHRGSGAAGARPGAPFDHRTDRHACSSSAITDSRLQLFYRNCLHSPTSPSAHAIYLWRKCYLRGVLTAQVPFSPVPLSPPLPQPPAYQLLPVPHRRSAGARRPLLCRPLRRRPLPLAPPPFAAALRYRLRLLSRRRCRLRLASPFAAIATASTSAPPAA